MVKNMSMTNTKNVYKTYSDLIKIPEFGDRVKYLKLNGIVGNPTFGSHRHLNQMLYKSSKWMYTRREVILRDNGYDLAHENYPIMGLIYIHHINPITVNDILDERPCVFDLENLVCASYFTHNAIHYGSDDMQEISIERKKDDTCLWR